MLDCSPANRERELGLDCCEKVSFTLLMKVVAMVIQLSTRGTVGVDIWYLCLAEKPTARSYHLLDYD